MKIILLVLLLVFIVFFLLACFVYLFEEYSCSEKGEVIGLKSDYRIIANECFLVIEGENIPYSRWINNTGN